jgi:H2-forming N5,N10-methylenetetrahydromethanopterin dehydrogenase-like enzyme
MARVALLCPDLLFGSKLSSGLASAGHEVVGAAEPADVLVVDLTDDVDERLRAAADASIPTLAFYAHVERDVRRRAEEAGIDSVVPRSRMAREAPRLVEAVLA